MKGGAARVLVLLAALAVMPSPAFAGGVETISPERLAGLLAAPDRSPLIIDLRPQADFMAGTVAGALHGQPDPGDFAPSGDIGEAVLIPPADGEAAVAAWATRLRELGVRPFLLEGGPQDWRDAGVRMEQPGPSYADPGAVPFVVPRGICEHLPPVQEY